MRADRAGEVLSAVKARIDLELDVQEQDELVMEGLIHIISEVTRRAMESEIEDLEQLTAKVRAASRAGDSPMGTRTMMAQPSQTKSEDYCRDLRRLESMLMRKASLECMVFSPRTGTNLSLTSEGERVVEDLEAWKGRYGGMELKELLSRLGAMRAEMSQTIARAESIARELRTYSNSRFLTSVRAPSLVLAERGSSAARAINVASAKGFEGGIDGDGLMMATLLSANEGTGEELAQRYQHAKVKAASAGIGGSGVFQALPLMGSSEASADLVLERMQALKNSLPLGDDDLAWLAQSDHGIDRAAVRYEKIIGSLTSNGMLEDQELRHAAAIMAGSKIPESNLLERFFVLHGKLQLAYSIPSTAAAMLAILPLEPEESLAVLRDSIGVVSRANFFDDAEEVNNLALLLTAGMGPKLVSEDGPARATYGSRVHEQDVEQFRTGPISTFLPFWVHQSYNQPTLRRIAAHPTHMHTVPYFG
jgi:hypothetical protein